MICECCGNEFSGYYTAVGDIYFCPDCFENLTVDELTEALGLKVTEGNSYEDMQADINDFKYAQMRDK